MLNKSEPRFDLLNSIRDKLVKLDTYGHLPMPPILRSNDTHREMPPTRQSRPPRTSPPKRFQQQQQRADERSITSATSGNSRPSSVVLRSAEPLSRDLSDLSGSYLNGNTRPRSSAAAATVHSDHSATSYQRPWRQGKILSAREPTHPQPRHDDDSVGAVRKTSVLVDRRGVVEVVDPAQRKKSLPSLEQLSLNSSGSSIEVENYRVPLILLLIDPGRKIYELMQLWVDAGVDTVRDVLQALQQNLADKWRQDYDGIFQVVSRQDRMEVDQLIHVLPIANYDVKPHEVWVAKPWAMSAKAAIPYAQHVVQHLRGLGIVQYASSSSLSPIRRKAQTKALTLTKDAQSRVYVPEGIMRHYHACQFLSFCPPFESVGPQVRVDVLAVGAESIDEGSSVSLSLKSSNHSVRNQREQHQQDAASSSRASSVTRVHPESLAAKDGEAVESLDDSYERGHARRRSLGNLLCGLNCSRRRALLQGFEPTENTFETSSKTLWRVWEDESINGSVVSESSRMPLLISKSSNWSTTMADF